MSDTNETREEYVARVESEGFRIVQPASNQLFVDIDSWDAKMAFEKSYEILLRETGVVDMERHDSSSGSPCEHITVTLPFEVDAIQRIAFQGALGSDPCRELLSLLRHMRGDSMPTIFKELALIRPAAGTEAE